MIINVNQGIQSPPMRRRGLKRFVSVLRSGNGVASHAEAWIETGLTESNYIDEKSPPMRRRGLKLFACIITNCKK